MRFSLFFYAFPLSPRFDDFLFLLVFQAMSFSKIVAAGSYDPFFSVLAGGLGGSFSPLFSLRPEIGWVCLSLG